MSVTVRPPGSPGAVPPIEEEPAAGATIDWQQVRDAVAGQATGIARVQAIAQLVSVRHPAAHRDLEKILANPQEPSRLRALAALNLARLPAPEVVTILIDALAGDDEQVLAAVFRALGRVGDERAVRAIEGAKYPTGVAEYQARFAAALISHRLGLEGHDLPEREGPLEELPQAAARPFRFTPVKGPDADYALRSLSRESFGIEYDEARLYDIRCAGHRWLIAFNRDVTRTGSLARFRERKAFPAILASWQQENQTYSARFLFLTAPIDGGRLRLHVHRLNGEPAFFGLGEIVDEVGTFSIRTVDAVGAFPLLVEGRYFPDGRLEFTTALSALFVRRWRTPAPDDRRRVSGA